MRENQVIIAARSLATSAGASNLPAPNIPAAVPASSGQEAALAAKLESVKWAQQIVRRYVTVKTGYEALTQMAMSIDAMVLELEDAELRAPEVTVSSACRAGRKLRDSFYIQANMAQKWHDPQFNPLLLDQASELTSNYFIDFVSKLTTLRDASKGLS